MENKGWSRDYVSTECGILLSSAELRLGQLELTTFLSSE
jgi:hypothetical protein